MGSCEHDTPMAPEMEAEVARVALAQGDLHHAAHHVDGILAADPTRADHLELFDAVCDAAGDRVLEVFGFESEGWFGRAATHALAMHRSGWTAEALPLLCNVASVVPHVPYLAWTRSWSLPDPAAVERSLKMLLRVQVPSAWQLALDCFVRRAAEEWPSNAGILCLASIGARRAGQLAEAVAWARQAVATSETWMGLVALANACRAVGDWEGAEAAWERGLLLDPEDASLLLDWGDSLLERGELGEAAARYLMALERDPTNAWAIGSLRWLEYRGESSMAAWVAFARWVRAHPDNERGADLLASATPWMGWLPDPSEATAHALAQAAEAGSSPERLTVEPAMPLPGAQAQGLAATLAGQPYDSRRWMRRAGELVLGAGPELIEELLAVAVHPPPVPQWSRVGVWLWRIQHAVAFLLAAMPGWRDDAAHVRALRSMIANRNDWTATAALAAVCARAERDPEVRETALDLALTVLQQPTRQGAWLTARPAFWVVLRLDLDDAFGLHGRAESWIDAEG